MKGLKISSLILCIVLFGGSLYLKNYFISVSSLLVLIYLLVVYGEWKKHKSVSRYNDRVLAGMNIVGFLIVILIIRLINLQVFKVDEYRKAVENQVLSKEQYVGNRGTIYDTTGKRLAYNINIYTLIINPKFALNDKKERIFPILKEYCKEGLLDDNYLNLKNEIIQLGNNKKQYKILRKNITDSEKDQMMEIIEKIGSGVVREKILEFRKENKRKYFRSDLFFNLIGNIGYPRGYKGEEKKGIFGIEKEYDNYLNGLKVNREIRSTRTRGIKLPTDKIEAQEDINGKDIYLTIDSDIQYILSDELKKEFNKTKAQEAYAIVVDPNTGRIIAESSFNRKKEVRNPVFQNQVEPGSIFKPIIVGAAMNEGYVGRYSTFDVGDGKIKKYGHTIRESSRHVKGILTVQEILEKSSNVGMVLIGDKFTDEKFEEYLKRYGLYDRTGVDFPYERKPYTVSYKRWDKLKRSTMAFGQGIAVTPIQMIMAFSTVINGGILYRPYLVDKVVNEDGVVVRRNLPKPVRRVLKPEVSATMRAILEKAVEVGTVKNAGVEGYRVGGKTGTAQISANGKYVRHEYLASTVGFFPANKPKYAILVMVYKPQADLLYHRFGGAVAAPVVGEVIRRVTKVKNILSEDIAQIAPGIYKENEEKIKIDENMEIMPDLKGLTARDVLNLFKNKNYLLKISGTGEVIGQYPKAGDKMENIKTITIRLK
ncbi:MAG: transpeptidase family protein [Cetobacterium sp.]|nr:transpeptidase family protein [Cetobacterium sp.]